MHQISGILIGSLFLALAHLPAKGLDGPAATPSTLANDSSLPETFGLTNIHHLDLEISAAEYDAMQPASGGRSGFEPGFRGGTAATPVQAKPAADIHRSGANAFPWVHASLNADGRAYKTVAVRYKGHFTYGATSQLLKRSLKIDLEHYEKGQRFGPLQKITLNAGILDPGRAREALAYAAYREAGVPAPRTAFAEVTLTVPGRRHREYLGLFTMIEDVDKPFLKDRFSETDGLLMKPEGVRGADYLGEDWQAYRMRYNPSREASAEERKLLMGFARLADQANTDEFAQKIGQYLNIDEFLRYLAVTAMIVDLDSPLAMPQNFFIYLPAKSKQLVFIPWDLDLSFAAWPMGGSPEQQMNLSLLHPYAGDHKLIARLLSDQKIRERYLAIIKELAAASFSQQELIRKIDLVEAAIKESLAKEAQAVSARHETEETEAARRIAAQAPELREFAVKRSASIQAQLTQPGEAYIPGASFGGPAGPGPNGLPPRLLTKLKQFGSEVEKIRNSGKEVPLPLISEKMRRIGPLLGSGKFQEAELLVDQAMNELKGSK